MTEKNILFVVEGKNDEPNFIRQMFLKCYPSSDYKIYSYEANIHMLASKLEKEYEDFENDELDILLFLKSVDENNNSLFDMKFTDVFLIFDFEPQHPDPHFITVRKMIRYFNQSDDRGKLFINYPMMQSYRHLISLPDQTFLSSKLMKDSFGKYKQIVSEQSFNNNVSSYDYVTFMSLAYHHFLKLIRILKHDQDCHPDINDYFDIDYAELFEIQYQNLTLNYLWILNTCIMLLVDYQPHNFFSQIDKHNTTFLLPD